MSSNIPKLRFLGFSEAWKNDIIGNKFHFISTNSLSRENLNYNEGSVKNIHYGDIHTLFRPLFDVTREKVPFINADALPNRITNDNYIQNGDVIFVDASEDYSKIGKCIEIINTNNEKIVAGLHTIHARAKNTYEFNSGFLVSLMKTDSVHKQIRVIAQGIKVLSISPTSLSNVVLYTPKKAEQKKIADFLSAVDSRVEGLEAMIALQKKYKQGVVQQIFNQTLRFKDNNGNPFPDWKETKLDKILIPNQRVVEKPQKPYWRLGIRSHAKGVFREYVKDYDKIMMDELFVVKTNDFILNITFAWEHAVAIISKEYDGLLVSHRFPTYKIAENIEPLFLQQLICRKEFKALLAKVSPGGAGRNKVLNKTDFLRQTVLIPHIDEQKKIADFLTAIDIKIEASKKQLDAARNWKKGLLQRMFV